jgi:hypothetical protein
MADEKYYITVSYSNRATGKYSNAHIPVEKNYTPENVTAATHKHFLNMRYPGGGIVQLNNENNLSRFIKKIEADKELPAPLIL